MARYSAADKEIDSVMREFNARPEDITAILKHRTDIKGHLGYLYIAHIEPKGNVLTIMYHPPPAHDEIRYELTLEPPVETIYDLKPRLRMMRDQARKHFTVPERPKIDYYSPPPLFPYVIPFIAAESLLAFAVFGWGSLADRFRALIQHYGGPYMLSVAQGFFALMHFFAEPAYILYQLRQHRTPISEGWKWLLTIVAVGFAGMDEWTECVEYEKLRHIYAKTDVGKLPARLERFTVSKEKKEL